jgi:hypothetical protein
MDFRNNLFEETLSLTDPSLEVSELDEVLPQSIIQVAKR